MEDELEKTKQSYQTQISTHEKKAHNNWVRRNVLLDSCQYQCEVLIIIYIVINIRRRLLFSVGCPSGRARPV